MKNTVIQKIGRKHDVSIKEILKNRDKYIYWRNIRKNGVVQRDAINKVYLYKGKVVYFMPKEKFLVNKFLTQRTTREIAA